MHYLNAVSASAGAVFIPAGAENGIGILTAQYEKDPTDPQWADTKEFKDLRLSMLLPSVNTETATNDFFPIEREQLSRWNGKSLVLFGKI